MLDISKITVDSVESVAAISHENAKTAGDVFKSMHGFYGTLFLSKFQTGQVDKDGKDMGIQSARAVWASVLGRYPRDVVGMALDAVLDSHPEFPPSLPEFAAICKARMPAKTYKHSPLAIGMSSELISLYSREAREAAMKNIKRTIDAETGYKKLSAGLAGLKEAIANAVATAGGDEVAELLRLDRIFSKREAA